MHIVQVQIRVKPECIEAFKSASRINGQASLQEPGLLRFDVLQAQDDPSRFMLWEVYRSAEDHASHRGTSHYAAWAEAVAPMMVEPRVGTKLTNVFPTDEAW